MFIGHLNILFSEAPALCIQYVLDSILFLDVCILSIIIQPVACHLTLFLVSLDGQEFYQNSLDMIFSRCFHCPDFDF